MAENDADDVYEIERIFAEDRVDGQMFYLVKWKGYPDDECTWEPSDNFTSQASIEEWQAQNAKGLGLPDEFLADLQQKMDEFQERNQERRDTIIRPKQDDEVAMERTIGPPTKKQKQDLDVEYSMSNKEWTVRKRGVASIIKPSSRARRASEAQMNPILTSKQAMVSRQPSAAITGKPGQRFRNLKHMNNYRKKSCAEPEPTLLPQKLKTVADFEIGRRVPHILPLSLKSHERMREDSPLFFPDTSHIQQDRYVSPARSESFLFPPARVDHEMDIDTNVAISSGNEQPRDIDAMEIDLKEDRVPAAGAVSEPIDDYPCAETPPDSAIIRAANGRWWYRGDIMCYFTMGKPIGDATIVDVPFIGFGSAVVALKGDHNNLILEFEPHGFNKQEFEAAFLNFYVPSLAVGVVSPFQDTAQSFEEFSEYLETNDSVAVLHLADSKTEMSLLLYSYRSASWKYLGRKPARVGRSRLHVAFLPRLVPRNNHVANNPTHQLMKAEPKRVETDEEIQPSSAVQRTQLPTRQLSAPPSTSHKVENKALHEGKSPLSPGNNSDPTRSLPQSPTILWTSRESTPTLMTPESPHTAQATTRDPRLRRLSSFADQAYDSGPAQIRKSIMTMQGWSKLEYKSLVSPTTLNARLNLDARRARFFIAFSREFPQDAHVVQNWLEKHVKSSNIYVDSQRHDWARFKEKAHETMSILLFHAGQSNYQVLDGLGTILCSEVPSCLSLRIERDESSKTGVWSAKMKQLFPRNAMYLITETMITDYLEDTIAVLQYFDSSKKPNYRIIMRPHIERWLLEYSTKEPDETRQGRLIDFLVLVRKLHLDPSADPDMNNDANGIFDAAGNTIESVLTTSYIVTPSTIVGYDKLEPKSSTTRESQVEDRHRRDEILKTFYYCYTALRVEKARRFISFYFKKETEQHLSEMKQKEKTKSLDCGHVMFWELEKFVTKFCQRSDKKKN